MGHAQTYELTPDKTVSNLIFQDRFDGSLSAWNITGAASIVTVDLSTKMQLANSSGIVSAKRTFTPQTKNFIIETDILYSASNAVSIQLLDSSGTIIGAADCGLTANTLSFYTNLSAAVSVTFTENTYNQLVFCVNPTTNIIQLYWINKAYSISAYNPLQLVASLSFSGVISAINYVTASGKTGTVNIDEVRCYIPDFAVIGDSISDGKRAGTLSWSSDPSTTHRLTGTPDQASSPNFLLGSFLGDNTFVGSRGFGGSETSQMVTFIQSLIVNQGFKRVFINCGFNDINRGYTAATIEANITAVINTLLSGGIKPRDILIANIFGSTALTGTKATVRDAYNTWLAGYSVTSGIRIVDANTALSTTPSTNSLLSTYDSGDGIHPNKLGSSVLAQTVMNRYYYNFIGVIR